MNKPIIKIEVVSDVVCPWCYIGKRRLEVALGQLAETVDFEVSYSPFELNAGMPEEGKPQREYLTAKFGGEERYEKLTAHVAGIAAAEGITFNYSKQQRSPNTRRMHRIIALAAAFGLQAAVKEAFMKAYFTDGEDLSDAAVLIRIAAAAGMDAERVTALLNSDEKTAEVVFAEQTNTRRGVSGVPFYIINDQYGISGAQPAEAFVQAFREITGGQMAAAGDSCTTDGDC